MSGFLIVDFDAYTVETKREILSPIIEYFQFSENDIPGELIEKCEKSLDLYIDILTTNANFGNKKRFLLPTLFELNNTNLMIKIMEQLYTSLENNRQSTKPFLDDEIHSDFAPHTRPQVPQMPLMSEVQALQDYIDSTQPITDIFLRDYRFNSVVHDIIGFCKSLRDNGYSNFNFHIDIIEIFINQEGLSNPQRYIRRLIRDAYKNLKEDEYRQAVLEKLKEFLYLAEDKLDENEPLYLDSTGKRLYEVYKILQDNYEIGTEFPVFSQVIQNGKGVLRLGDMKMYEIGFILSDLAIFIDNGNTVFLDNVRVNINKQKNQILVKRCRKNKSQYENRTRTDARLTSKFKNMQKEILKILTGN